MHSHYYFKVFQNFGDKIYGFYSSNLPTFSLLIFDHCQNLCAYVRVLHKQETDYSAGHSG